MNPSRQYAESKDPTPFSVLNICPRKVDGRCEGKFVKLGCECGIESCRMKDKIFGNWVSSLPSLEGKVVAITGTTSGTGYWTAVAAIKNGAALVLLLNRQSPRSESSEKELKLEVLPDAKTKIQSINCDLMSFESVRSAASEISEIVKEYGGLDVLVNNAGIMGFPDNRTIDGFDVQMQTNHLGHFLLSKLLLKSLQDAGDSRGEARIVQHSSGARNFFGPLEAQYFEKCEPNTLGGNDQTGLFTRYHQTKLANTCFAMMLHKKLSEHGITNIKSVVAEPGVAETSLVSNLKDASSRGFAFRLKANVMMFYYRFFIGMQSAADGACPLIEAAFGSGTESGDFYHPEKRYAGKPYKAISKGEVVSTFSRERKTMNEESQKMLWEKSEEAIGEKFFSNL